jgi:hypothetical protein
MIHYHNTHQNTDRFARTIVNVAICRDFSRAMLPRITERQWTITDRSHKYRPRTARTGTRCLAGLSSPR